MAVTYVQSGTNCKCIGREPQKAGCNTCVGPCSSIGGGSGELTLTATFSDIAVGDGSNGVDVRKPPHVVL